MNKELFDSMRKQMTPSPEVRASLSEKLAVKKRPVPWRKYGAVAACAALVIGAFPLYRTIQAGQGNPEILWTHRAGDPLHSYVTVEGLAGYVTENTAAIENTMTGGGDTGALPDRDDFPNTGDLPNAPSGALPGGAYIGDAPSQDEAVDAYQKLMDRFDGVYPDWYGGAYIDGSACLVVQLVSSEDPGDKSLELQVLDWTDDGRVAFSSCKYSLRYLRDLQEKVVDEMNGQGLFASCGADEEANRLDLTLTDVTDEALALLAELDPEDDAIYVQVGQRITVNDAPGEVVTTDSAKAEDPAVHHVMPGGATSLDTPVSEGDDLIADEPYYDGAHYDVEELPQSKQPAAVQSVPEEDVSSIAYAAP